MPGSAWGAEAIVPAQLSFLTLYNPSLGRTDDTLHNQVLYYYSSKSARRKSRKSSAGDSDAQEHEERNERLRQIGLAQGMVEFAKSFSDGANLDSIDSEKSRILLHELESGWWILASIDLTRIQSTPNQGTTQSTQKIHHPAIEYSSREVCPQPLLLQHLLRAHSIFLLHHGPSLAELYERLTRERLCGALGRFWNHFVRNWDVLLHGNPAVDIYNGLKLAAGGELGIGVGEEEWGSGEREVLEDFIGRTDGLVDVVVSRFGDSSEDGTFCTRTFSAERGKSTKDVNKTWLASGTPPRSSDGVIFSGIGAISRSSLRNISAWTEWLYIHGEAAYGVRDNPHSARRKKRRKPETSEADSALKPLNSSSQTYDLQSRGSLSQSYNSTVSPRSQSTVGAGIPPPLVVAVENSSAAATSATDTKVRNKLQRRSRTPSPAKHQASNIGTETLMKYMTLGIYGSSWGFPARKASSRSPRRRPRADEAASSDTLVPKRQSERILQQNLNEDAKAAGWNPYLRGSFIIGLHGNIEDEGSTEEFIGYRSEGVSDDDTLNSRISVRTLYLERKPPHVKKQNVEGPDDLNDPYNDRLRVVVYVRQPFIFTFLFSLRTDSLSLPSFYRSLHYQLGPLQRPLLSSTAPENVYERLWLASSPTSTTPISNAQPIYDLVYDPSNLTVHTTIPGIPEAGTLSAEGLEGGVWTRIEALNVHSQILHTYISTRKHAGDLEQTCKTSRGWWVVWMRLPWSDPLSQAGADSFREAFLIRKASDYTARDSKKGTGMFGLGSSEGIGWGPARLAEGIGIDTKRYIEGLLSLNR